MKTSFHCGWGSAFMGLGQGPVGTECLCLASSLSRTSLSETLKKVAGLKDRGFPAIIQILI